MGYLCNERDFLCDGLHELLGVGTGARPQIYMNM